MTRKAVMALSGGVDSTTVLAWLLVNGYDVSCVSFVYGSKHNRYELQCAEAVFNHYKNNPVVTNARQVPGAPIHHVTIDMMDVFSKFDSALMGGNDRDIPEGHYTDKTMSQTVVPARNIIFLSVLAGFAKSEGASVIAPGIHQGDHAIYADCRTEFYKAMDTAIYLGTDREVGIVAPFVDVDKTEIISWGLAHSTPYTLTRTCYKNQAVACGRCGACVERLESFRNLGVRDPIPYEHRDE